MTLKNNLLKLLYHGLNRKPFTLRKKFIPKPSLFFLVFESWYSKNRTKALGNRLAQVLNSYTSITTHSMSPIWISYDKNSFLVKKNHKKAPGYVQDDLRLPIFVKKAFGKIKIFFLGKTLSSKNFLTFPTFKIFWFFAENLVKRAKRHFYETLSFDTHSTPNLSPYRF